MTLVIDAWQIVAGLTTVVTFLAGVLFTLGKLLMKQFNHELTTRFDQQEKARDEAAKRWDGRFHAMSRTIEAHAEKVEGRVNAIEQEQRNAERALASFRLDVAESRVHRDEHVRSLSIIESKIDGLALKLENVQLKQGKN
jgi:hypothetical protein